MQDQGSINNTTQKKGREEKEKEKKKRKGRGNSSSVHSRKQLASRKSKFLKIHMKIENAYQKNQMSQEGRRKKAIRSHWQAGKFTPQAEQAMLSLVFLPTALLKAEKLAES